MNIAVKLESPCFSISQGKYMKYIIRCRRINFVIAVLLSALLSAQAAEPEPADIIQYRKSVMKARREHIAAATLIIQGKVDFKNQLIDHARALGETNRDTAGMFPNGSDVGDTAAMGAVWSNNAEFQKRSKDTEQKAAKFAQTVVAGDAQNYSTHLNELLDSCKFCHKDFRKKETK
jgi:cytochrome c556